MNDLPEQMLLEGISVEIKLCEPRPLFGDLFLICGEPHPDFPPMGSHGFEDLADLQFDQCDDYFCVRSLADDGDDTIIWLYPIVAGEPVDHDPGPYDGLRLEFNVLRNPARHGDYFLGCVERFRRLGCGLQYRSRNRSIETHDDLSVIKADMEAIVASWRARAIVPGSPQALDIDF